MPTVSGLESDMLCILADVAIATVVPLLLFGLLLRELGRAFGGKK